MIDWQSVENALRSWVVGASSLTGGDVRWGRQNAPGTNSTSADPSQQIIMMIEAVEVLGYDGVDVIDNPTPSAGQEILLSTIGQRRGTLSLNAFGSPSGAMSPYALLEVVCANIPRYVNDLDAAGVGIARPGNITVFSQQFGRFGQAVIEPRARVEIPFYLAQDVSVPDTYIEFVQTEDETRSEINYIPENPT